jgi:hypothetical protein
LIAGHQRISGSEHHEAPLRQFAGIRRVLRTQRLDDDAVPVLEIGGMKGEHGGAFVRGFQGRLGNQEPGGYAGARFGSISDKTTNEKSLVNLRLDSRVESATLVVSRQRPHHCLHAL